MLGRKLLRKFLVVLTQFCYFLFPLRAAQNNTENLAIPVVTKTKAKICVIGSKKAMALKKCAIPIPYLILIPFKLMGVLAPGSAHA
jgi:hypothetical protein